MTTTPYAGSLNTIWDCYAKSRPPPCAMMPADFSPLLFVIFGNFLSTFHFRMNFGSALTRAAAMQLLDDVAGLFSIAAGHFGFILANGIELSCYRRAPES